MTEQCTDGGELEPAGPPDALRALSRLLGRSAERVEVPITGGTVVQEMTSGPLLVSRPNATTLAFSGGRDQLDIIGDALDGVAEESETAEDRNVNRHQHIEYLPGDTLLSPASMPLTIVADWPPTR
ncbi:Imm32 family immunity protein [Actinoplanes sp. CA-054009]